MSGSCQSHGMEMLTSKQKCEAAAVSLEKGDQSAYASQFNGRPFGCIYHPNEYPITKRLVWFDPKGSRHKSSDCGSQGYECICENGKVETYRRA